MTAGIVDFHVHSGPSLVARHFQDPETSAALDRLGVERFVLKAHEGSTAERARLLGERARGGIVLNSSTGGANPDAVDVAARLGAAVVWLPTASSVAHQAQSPGAAGSEVHDSFTFAAVPVVEGGQLVRGWADVLDVVANYDLILASGHLPMDEVLVVFREAKRRGVTRFLVNHPLPPYLRWSTDAARDLRALDVHVEIGVLADQMAGSVEQGTGRLLQDYPPELFVFGSDLGFAGYTTYEEGYAWWIPEADRILGAGPLHRALSSNGHQLLGS